MNGIKLKKNFSVRPKMDAKAQEAKLRDASKMYEKQFLREIMKAMKKTVSHSSLSKPGYAENIYQNQLDNQYVEKWGDKGGIGLADLIFEQIKERHFKNKNIQKPNGPIPIESGSRFLKNKKANESSAIPIKVKATEKDLTYILNPEKLNLNSSKVTSPWSGQIKNIYSHQDQKFIEVSHPQGVSSLLGFTGTINEDLKIGDSLNGGQELGNVTQPQQSLYWKMSSGPEASQA